MAAKGLGFDPALLEYLVAHGTPPDAVQQGLIEKTRALGPESLMQIAPEQGAFMTFLARAVSAKQAIEVGTFTGYSALALARGLPADGKLLCLDISEEWVNIGRPFWKQAGVEDRIEVRIGPAQESLAALPEQEQFDLAFIDADKPNYKNYLELLYPRMRGGGILLIDNVLWFGQVIDESDTSENTLAIRAFNEAVAADERFDRAILPIADGLTLLRKRTADELGN